MLIKIKKLFIKNITKYYNIFLPHCNKLFYNNCSYLIVYLLADVNTLHVVIYIYYVKKCIIANEYNI